MSDDLKALDGNALVARLAVVRERVLGQSREDGLSAAELDTEAVLDECGVRLLEPGPRDLAAMAGVVGAPDKGAGFSGYTAYDVERLRGLIRNAYLLISRARDYQGYGPGPLSEPFAAHVERGLADEAGK